MNNSLTYQVLSSNLYKDYCKLKRDIYFNDLDFTLIYDSLFEMGYSVDEIKEIERIHRCYIARKKRIKNRINDMVKAVYSDDKLFMLFLTFTLNNDHINMDKNLLRIYVRRVLNDTAISYVANLDYGEKFGRFHFHAVVLLDTPQPWAELWKNRGFVKLERIYINDNAVNKVANYVSKLSHHGLKTSTRFESLIYSRKKKGKN